MSDRGSGCPPRTRSEGFPSTPGEADPVAEVYFETIRPIHFPLVSYHLLRGRRIFVFGFSDQLKRIGWLRRLMNAGKVIRLFIAPYSAEHGEAIDKADALFAAEGGGPLCGLIRALYGEQEVDLVFKKCLLEDVFRCVYINRFLARLTSIAPTTPRILICEEYQTYRRLIDTMGRPPLHPLPGVSICAGMYALVSRMMRNLHFYCSALGYPAIFVFAALAKNRTELGRFQYAVSLENRFHIKFQGRRSFDFLLDGTRLRKDNTLFIARFLPEESWLRRVRADGYHIMEAAGSLNMVAMAGAAPLGGAVAPALRAAFGFLLAGAQRGAFVRAFFTSLKTFLDWNGVLGTASFMHFVYTNQEFYSQIAINVLLRSRNIATWYYSSFIGGGLLMSKNGDIENHRHVLLAYLNADNFVGINAEVNDCFQRSRTEVRAYRLVGSLYSQLVREESESIDRARFLGSCFGRAVEAGVKAIAFFDTTYLEAPGTYYDLSCCLDFYSDVLRFAGESPDVLVLVKPSNDEDYYLRADSEWSSPRIGRRIVELFAKLRAMPNVFWAGSAADNPAIMAVSDLVVTHCFSSTAVEALGARKKSIWYEPDDLCVGMYYDRIPGLTFHGYDSLASEARRLLGLPDAQYGRYLDEHVRGRLEYLLDGRALDRFRALLAAETERVPDVR